MAGNKIIGGEFEIEMQKHFQQRNVLPEDIITYSSGRSAFYNILLYLKEKKGIKSILLPDYLCESIYQTAEKVHIGIEFYTLDEMLNPDRKDITFKYDDNKAVLLINYFGLIDSKSMIEHLRDIHKEMIIILDNVQAPYAMLIDTDADFMFSSFRKAFPVVDGSWVISKSISLQQHKRTNDFAQYKIAASYLKAIRGKHFYHDEIYLDLYNKGEMMIDDDYLTDMSQLSKDILADMQWNRIAILRKRNVEFVLKGLKKIGISPVIPVEKQNIPLFIPIRIENRDYVRKAMFTNNIFLPVHWPVEENHKHKLKRGTEMAAHELSIIIDQRYSINDMKKILYILESNI